MADPTDDDPIDDELTHDEFADELAEAQDLQYESRELSDVEVGELNGEAASSLEARKRRPAEPTHKSSAGNIVLPIVAVLGLALIGFAAYMFLRSQPAVDASNRFLEAIDAGDYAGAAAQTFGDDGQAVNSACGVSEGEIQGVFQGADISYDLNRSEMTNETTSQVFGVLSAPGTQFSKIQLILLKSQGEWRVCRVLVS